MAQWHSVVDVVVVVVGAALLEGGRLLAAQRVGPPYLAGRWELPGGKVEPGESDADALVRECREELGAEVRLRERLGGDWPLGHGVVMRVWFAELAGGSVRPLEHRALRWLARDELFSVDWLPADLPIIEALRIRLDGHERGVV